MQKPHRFRSIAFDEGRKRSIFNFLLACSGNKGQSTHFFVLFIIVLVSKRETRRSETSLRWTKKNNSAAKRERLQFHWDLIKYLISEAFCAVTYTKGIKMFLPPSHHIIWSRWVNLNLFLLRYHQEEKKKLLPNYLWRHFSLPFISCNFPFVYAR